MQLAGYRPLHFIASIVAFLLQSSSRTRKECSILPKHPLFSCPPAEHADAEAATSQTVRMLGIVAFVLCRADSIIFGGDGDDSAGGNPMLGTVIN
jgi:hypothetical protein